ncbi:MAG: hypothetical protein WCQ66_01135 [Sphaerochaetaceae bacterium]
MNILKYENFRASQGEVKWVTVTRETNVKTITLAVQGQNGGQAHHHRQVIRT